MGPIFLLFFWFRILFTALFAHAKNGIMFTEIEHLSIIDNYSFSVVVYPTFRTTIFFCVSFLLDGT
jgi:hypothetical protein